VFFSHYFLFGVIPSGGGVAKQRMNVSRTENQERTSNHVIILWCTTFSLIAIAILCANALTIAVFTVKKLLRKNSNILLLNLACADLMIGGIAMPLYICIFYKALSGHQWYDNAVHEIYITVDIFAGLSSMFILTAIALERAYSVFLPFKHRGASRRFYWSSATFMWVMAGCLACLKLLTSRRILPSSYDNNIILIFVSFALVTIIMAYASVWKKIHSRRKESMRNALIVNEKLIVQAMLIVTVAFIGMWMPIYVLNVVGSFDSKTLLTVPPNAIYFAKLLQYCNSIVNPIIYSLKIPQFRKAMRRLGHKSSVRTVRTENV